MTIAGLRAGPHDWVGTLRLSVTTVLINAAVVTALVGGVTAYATFNNEVELTIDGETRTVHTFGDTVEDVLADQGVELGPHDEVVPSLSSPIQDGSHVGVRYGRHVGVVLDGVDREFWTTALSVDELLVDMGIRQPGAQLSVSRSLSIGRQGVDFEVRTVKTIALVDGGEQSQVTTTAITVREALRDLDIILGDRDQVEPTLEARIATGSTLMVKRVTTEEETVTIAVEYETVEKADDSLYEDQTAVEQDGADGETEQVIEIVYVDGEETERNVLSEKVLTEPTDRVVLVGTKERPAISDGEVWDALAQCESGGNWSINTGNGYYGGLQFNLQTWQAYGGTGYPHEHSREEQIRIAIKLRDDRGGYGAWPACSSKLGLPR